MFFNIFRILKNVYFTPIFVGVSRYLSPSYNELRKESPQTQDSLPKKGKIMKIVLIRSPKILAPILKKIFSIK